MSLLVAAQEYMRKLGMPRRNNELWSFFPVNKIPAPEFMKEESQAVELAEDSFGLQNEKDFAAILPFANGTKTFTKEIPEGASEMGIIKSQDDFSHSVFNIGKNAKVSLEILDNKVIHPICAERFDINVAEGAEVEIFFANPVRDLPLHFRHFNIKQAAGSILRFSEIEQGTGINRTSLDCYLQGEGARFEIRVLNALSSSSESHHRLNIYHQAPNTQSMQFARNLLDGNSKVSYDGSVEVGEGCTNTNSSQLVNTILLSEDSCVSVKPVLKIYHDDVECTHGNTCGELNAEQMFYLTSRGIPEKSARMLLMKAFSRELFLPLLESPARKRLMQVLDTLA